MQNRTKWILFLSSALQVPFVSVNLMLDVLLSSHFHASTLQISCLTTMRPLLAVLAFYWGSFLLFKPKMVKFSLVAATFLAPICFLFATFFDSILYFVLAEACFFLFWRAQNPAQMEILKLNLDKGQREKIFSRSLSISYATGIIIGPFLGLFLQYYPHLWKELFTFSALLYSASSLVKSRYLLETIQEQNKPIGSIKKMIVEPWRASIQLLKRNRPFLQFQTAIFIAGSGLMFLKPTIPGFLTHANLSFLEIFSLFTLLEGAGFVLASTVWAKNLQKLGLNTTTAFVMCCFCMQPILLFVGTTASIFMAYFVYGIAQSGSKLVWNLSGPMLCGSESSAQYSSVNILAIGIRGICMPLLGAFCTTFFGHEISLFVSFSSMLFGAGYLMYVTKKELAFS